MNNYFYLFVCLVVCHCCYTIVPEPEIHVCQPSPCGPYSQCKEYDGRAICTCIENFIGSPPACRPECTINSECPLNRACINHKCVDPCASSVCGESARCQPINHNPICSCPLGFTGDPFVRCIPEESKLRRTSHFCMVVWMHKISVCGQSIHFFHFSNTL